MRRVVALLVLLLVVCGVLPVAARAEARTPGIVLDGLPLESDVAPVIESGRTLAPFRAIAEALGVEVTWHQPTWSVEARAEGTEVWLTIGFPYMIVNGTAVPLDVPPRIVNGRTLIPLRAFSEAFGATVGWDGESYTVLITSPVRQMRMLGFYALRSFPNRSLVPMFSDVAYGWSRLNPDGTLDLHGIDYYWPEPAGEITPERLLADAREAGTRRYLMVYSPDHDLRVTNLVLDEATTATFVESVAALLAEKDFDGVVLDLEGLGWSDTGERLEQVRAGYVRLVTAMALRLQPEGRTVGVSVPPPYPNGAFQGYDYAALAPVVDFIQIMAYEYIRERPQPAELVDEAARMAAEVVGPAYREKLLLGIWLHETPESLVEKVGLAKRHGLGGIAYWTIGGLVEADVAALATTVTRTE